MERVLPPCDRAARHTTGTFQSLRSIWNWSALLFGSSSRQRGQDLFGPDLVRQVLTPLEGADVRQGCVGDVGQRFASEERLVRCNEHIGEGEETGQHVVLQDLVGEVAKEDAFLFLVDAQSGCADLAPLEGINQRTTVEPRSVVVLIRPRDDR